MVARVAKRLLEEEDAGGRGRAGEDPLAQRVPQGREYTRRVPRLLLAAAAAIAVTWFLASKLVTTATERVEEITRELLEHARKGGPEAAEAILAALADDFRGGSYSREEVERAIRRHVGGARVRELRAPRVRAEWSEDEVAAFVLLRAELPEGPVLLGLQVLFAERGGEFRIVDVRSAR